MENGQEACPSCGAQVFPEEVKCPVCGHRLHSQKGARLLVGAVGTALALVAGAGVWWLLAAPATTQIAAPKPQAAVAPAPQPAGPSSPGSIVPAMPPPPAWPANGARDQPAEAEAEEAAPESAAPVAPAAGPAIPATVEERRAFAKESEKSLTANGLQVTVSTSGENDTTLVMTFAYPATTTAELIVAGPFAAQCERRGFKRIVFVDPGEVSLVYDIATQTLSKR